MAILRSYPSPRALVLSCAFALGAADARADLRASFTDGLRYTSANGELELQRAQVRF